MRNNVIAYIIFVVMMLNLFTSCSVNEVPGDKNTYIDLSDSSENTDIYGTEEIIGAGDKKEEEQMRYFIYRIWNFTLTPMPVFRSTVDTVVEDGFNAIKVHIPWTQCEKVRGKYDFSAFDEMIDYVVNVKGLHCAVSIDLTRLVEDSVFNKDQYMYDINGELSCAGVDNRAQISFCDEDIISSAVDFYRAAVEHYNGLFGDNILFYLPAFSQYCETEYWPSRELDYSDKAVEGFRGYCSEVFGGDIAEFNDTCRKNYGAFSDIEAPSCSATDNIGMLWYRYRHNLLKNAIDKLAMAQHSSCPGTKIAIQIGCVWDSAASYLRVTAGFSELCENIDVLWVDDGPLFDHAWSCDYTRSNIPDGVELAQEIDGPYQNGAAPESYLRQGLQCFEYGCKYVSIANWSMNDEYNEYRSSWREISDTWLGESTPEVKRLDKTGDSIEISLRKVFSVHGALRYQSDYSDKASDGKPVYIRLNDDMLHVKPEKQPETYSFPASFSSRQGNGGWYYLSHKKGVYSEMTYDPSSGMWRGEKEFNLVMNGSIHPDAYDTVLKFVSPADGNTDIEFDLSVVSDQSDGVRFTVMLGSERIYPADGTEYAKIRGAGSLSDTVSDVELITGDELYFIFNKGSTNAFDTTSAAINVKIN